MLTLSLRWMYQQGKNYSCNLMHTGTDSIQQTAAIMDFKNLEVRDFNDQYRAKMTKVCHPAKLRFDWSNRCGNITNYFFQ